MAMPEQDLACRIEGEGPDVVLLHGGAGSWTHWVRTIPALRDRYRVLAFDLPGFGDSPAFLSDEDHAYFAWIADAILKHCAGPIRLVGFSFGGTVAAAAAALLGGQLRALSLAAPGSFGEPLGRSIDVRQVRPRNGEDFDARGAARHNLQQVMFSDPQSIDEPTLDLHLANIARARFKSHRLSWQDRIESDLAPITAPIQMIWGRQDRMATPSVEARVVRCQAINPAIRFDLIPDAGHWVQYEQPSAFNAALLSFLQTSEGDGRRHDL